KSAYLFRANLAKYPLEAIQQAADLSGKRGAGIAAQQVRLLGDTNDIVRYWAALGLLCQSPEMIATHRNALYRAIEDPYPPVAITVAAIGWHCFSDPGAAATLIRYADGEDRHLALLSINY